MQTILPKNGVFQPNAREASNFTQQWWSIPTKLDVSADNLPKMSEDEEGFAHHVSFLNGTREQKIGSINEC